MTEWRDTTLGEALEIYHGFAFRGEYFRDEGALILLTPGNFNDSGGFKPKSGQEKYYDGPVPPEYLLSKGDVVVAMTEQAHGLLGSTATIPASDRYLHNQRLGLLHVTDPDKLDLRFCYHLMNTPIVRHQIQATATGAKVRHTAPERIRAVRVRLPDVSTQRVVSGILDALDDLVQNNRRQIELLEQMAQAIYDEWFVRFRYPGHDDATLVDSPWGKIPEDWEASTVKEFVELVKVTVDPRVLDPTTPAIGLEHIPRRQLTLSEWDTSDGLGSRKAVFKKGDVLFGKIRPYFHKVSVAPLDGICSTDALVIRPADDYWGLSVLTIFSDNFVANATQTANGTKMPRADWKVIKEFPVVVPPLILARRFTVLTRDMLGASQRLMLENRELSAIRNLLLPKLVNGYINVSRLDLTPVMESMA
jgi:type I restriction enzyme S subunit